MSNPPRPTKTAVWDDQRIEIILGNLLRTGVIFSAVIVLAGASIYLFRHAHEAANYRIFRGEPSDFALSLE